MQISKAPMSEDAAARVLAALKNGKTLNSICGGRVGGERVAGERIAYYEQFRAYCAIHPEYARETDELLVANTELANARKGSKKRSQTHCIHGHLFAGRNLLIEPKTGFRRCRVCTMSRMAAPRPLTQAEIQKVTAALNEGQTISKICWGKIGSEKVAKPIIGFNLLKRHREANPVFDRFVSSVMVQTRSRAWQRRQNSQLFHTNVIRAQTNDYHAVADMVPQGLPPDVRDDIVQSIFMALIEGSLQRNQVRERIREFVTAHNRDANKHGVGKFGLISLDAPIFDDGSGSLGDRVSRGLWD